MTPTIFSISALSRILCIAMDLVKNSRLKVTGVKVGDMNRVKNDVLNVKYSLNGRDCGVLVVDVC